MSALGFSAGISGLQAAQAAIQTIGHNISNQATPGYSRQDVILKASNPIALNQAIFGTGVVTGSITRSVDNLLLKRLQSQQSQFGYYSVQYNRLSELESFLNEPTDKGLGAQISKYFASVASLSGSPEDSVMRQGLLSSSKSLALSFNTIANKIFSHRVDLQIELTNQVNAANKLANGIAALNGQILAAEGGTGVQANDLRDQRDQAIRDLSNLVSVNAIEDSNGSVRVQVGGYLIVSNNQASTLELGQDPNGDPQLTMTGTDSVLSFPGGLIGGLIGLSGAQAKNLGDSLDTLAKNLILEVNRHHSTGIGKEGSYTSLTATISPLDTNGNGNFGDELLTNENFPFPIQNGVLYVNVVNTTTGDFETSKITIDPTTTTMSGLASKFSAITGIGASVDAVGRLRISSQSGYEFDFSPRLDANPNTQKAFGGASGTISSTKAEPFALTNGDTLQIAVDGGANQSFTFNTADFANIGAATAKEVAAKINAGPPALVGATAKAVDGRLVIVSNQTGSTSSIKITDGAGAPAADMGLSTVIDSGDATGVSVTISGSYSGTTNEHYIFKADQNGTIGVDAGLTVGVFDAAGNRVATLDVGANYQIGQEINVVNGIKVAFGAGMISNSAGDFAALDAIADSDTADLLPALGINTFFNGNSASTIEVNPDLDDDPDLIAASLNGLSGDNANLLRILNLQSKTISSLNDKTFEQYYGNEIGKVGYDVSNSKQLTETQQFVLESLDTQRLQISGVSVDEELAKLLQFQQMFEAVSKFITTLSDLERGLINSL